MAMVEIFVIIFLGFKGVLNGSSGTEKYWDLNINLCISGKLFTTFVEDKMQSKLFFLIFFLEDGKSFYFLYEKG